MTKYFVTTRFAAAVLAITFLAACSRSAAPTSRQEAASLEPAQAAHVDSAEHRPRFTQFPPESVQSRMLADLADAENVELLSLQPWDMGAYFDEVDKNTPPEDAPDAVKEASNADEGERQQRAQQQWCEGYPCLFGNRVVGRVATAVPAQLDFVRETLDAWAARHPDYLVGCEPQYHHAIVFEAGGRHYDVLLCYTCGQYAIAVDGKMREGNQAAAASGLKQFNALLEASGIPAYTPSQ
jgi:hypothetical protein